MGFIEQYRAKEALKAERKEQFQAEIWKCEECDEENPLESEECEHQVDGEPCDGIKPDWVIDYENFEPVSETVSAELPNGKGEITVNISWDEPWEDIFIEVQENVDDVEVVTV